MPFFTMNLFICVVPLKKIKLLFIYLKFIKFYFKKKKKKISLFISMSGMYSNFFLFGANFHRNEKKKRGGGPWVYIYTYPLDTRLFLGSHYF